MIYCSVCGTGNPLGNVVCHNCSAHPLQPLPPAESSGSPGLVPQPTLSIRAADSHDTLETAAAAFSVDLASTKQELSVDPTTIQPGLSSVSNGAHATLPGAANSASVQHPTASANHSMARTAQSHVAPEVSELVGFLVSFQQTPDGTFWVLRAGENRVGRSRAGQVLQVAIDDVTTSSMHAIIRAEPEYRTMQLADQGSANGTFLNGRRLPPDQPRELRDGDRVRFGGFETVIKIAPRVGLSADPDADS